MTMACPVHLLNEKKKIHYTHSVQRLFFASSWFISTAKLTDPGINKTLVSIRCFPRTWRSDRDSSTARGSCAACEPCCLCHVPSVSAHTVKLWDLLVNFWDEHHNLAPHTIRRQTRESSVLVLFGSAIISFDPRGGTETVCSVSLHSKTGAKCSSHPQILFSLQTSPSQILTGVCCSVCCCGKGFLDWDLSGLWAAACRDCRGLLPLLRNAVCVLLPRPLGGLTVQPAGNRLTGVTVNKTPRLWPQSAASVFRFWPCLQIKHLWVLFSAL